MAGCGADVTANTLLTSLLQGKDFNITPPDLSDPEYQIPDVDIDVPVELTNADLTTKTIDGTGTFDVIMKSIHNHLKGEYETNRITGQEYTKAYIELSSSSLSGAIQFLLAKNTSYWQAILIKNQAMLAAVEVVKARVELATSKVLLAVAQIQALTAEAEYGLTKMKIATEDAAYCSAIKDIEIKQYTLGNMLPEQVRLLKEQVEVQRAQTSDSRTDGFIVAGSVGKQKDLYTQQITSYKRDSELKAAKIFTDAWITQKTLDEGLLPPNSFTNISLEAILVDIKTNNDIG